MKKDFKNEKLEIEYPTKWTYKIIGEDEDLIREAIAVIAGDHEHDIELSRSSKFKKYSSITFNIFVVDENHRLSILHSLGKHKNIKFIL